MQTIKVVTCQSVAELRQFVGAECLTMDVGGALKYNHLEWVQHRMVSFKKSLLTLFNEIVVGFSLKDLFFNCLYEKYF